MLLTAPTGFARGRSGGRSADYVRTEEDQVMKFRRHLGIVFGAVVWLLLTAAPRNALAVPQYARRYHLKCYACHTIPPVLNEQGYMFQRLGHHLPASLDPNSEIERIIDLVRKEPEWRLTNNASMAVSDFNFSAQRSTTQGQAPSSTSAIQVGSWNAYFGGWIPNTQFFYYSEFDIVTNGQTNPNMPNAHIGYVGGNAKSSWYATVGREHLQVTEGTRAAEVYSLLPTSPLIFENQGPTNFVLDQSPVAAEAGYTWASSKYRDIFGVNLKVTNGDHADGSEILTSDSTKNSKDVWLDADWWYAPESGVSFVTYQGQKTQIQNSGLANQFSYYGRIRREGAFANYMIGRDKVDVLGGYLHGNDDWENPATGAPGSYLSNGYFAEIDYYVQRGFALAGRYDRLRQDVTGGVHPTNLEQWQTGVEKAFTSEGNIVGRLAVGNFHGIDPVAFTSSANRTYEADIQFNF